MQNFHKICAVALLALLTACETINPTAGNKQTYEQQISFPDLPVPPKGKLIPSESLILGRDRTMTGMITLEAEMTVERAFLFYQQQMPPAGWKEVTSLQGKTSSIIFSKPDRIASITIRNKLDIFQVAIVEIIISPNRGNAQGQSLLGN